MSSETNSLSSVPVSRISKEASVLVLGGGGIKGLVQLGVLHCLYINKYLLNIKTFIGTSIGSFISYLLIIGFTPLEIFSHFCTKELENSLDIKNIGLINLITKFGLFNFDIFSDELEKMTETKLEFVPTLSELFEYYNKELICVTYNLSTRKIEYLNRHTHPNLSCLDAIRMSSNIPLLFERFIYDNNFFIDGAFGDNFPIIYADQLFNSGDSPRVKILGVSVEPEHGITEKNAEKLDFVHYVYSIMSIPVDANKKLAYSYTSPNVNTINVITGELNAVNFKLQKKQKFEYFSTGFRHIENLLGLTHSEETIIYPKLKTL